MENDEKTPRMPWTARCASLLAWGCCALVTGAMAWVKWNGLEINALGFLFVLIFMGMAIGIGRGHAMWRELAAAFAIAAIVLAYADWQADDLALPHLLLLPIVAMALLLYLPASNQWFGQYAAARGDAQGRRWTRIVKKCLRAGFRLALLAALAVVVYFALDLGESLADWRFANMAQKADRVVIYDDGRISDTDAQEPLYVITAPQEIAEFRSLFKFRDDKWACFCVGAPSIDWWRGSEKLAHTALKHGLALRWDEFGGAAPLTPESRSKVQKWFKNHDISIH